MRGRVECLCVLLGGLYEGTKAPQGKDGSATDVMSAAKRQIVNEGWTCMSPTSRVL